MILEPQQPLRNPYNPATPSATMSRWVPAIILAMMLAVAVPICADDTDAQVRPDDYPTSLVELQFWHLGTLEIVHVFPYVPVKLAWFPAIPTGCTCWVREDTREVVDDSTVFAPGSYLIKAYTVTPTPWDPEPTPDPEPSKDGKGTVEISTTAVCIGCGAVVIAVAVLGYFAVRRH